MLACAWVRGLIFDWLPFAAWLVLYDLSRFFSETIGTVPHVSPQIHADRLLFGDPIPTVRLQAALTTAGQLQWFDYLVWGVYMTHFFAVWVVAAVLWRVSRRRFRRYVATMVALTVAAFLTYWLYPAQPPWLAGG